MLNEVLTIVGTMPFWVHFILIFAMGCNILWLIGLVRPKVKGWLAHRRYLKTMALLKRSPSALMADIKDKMRHIDHLEDKVLSLKAELDRAEEREKDLREEVRRLIKRNGFMANEIRCDTGAETQVLREKYSARF